MPNEILMQFAFHEQNNMNTMPTAITKLFEYVFSYFYLTNKFNCGRPYECRVVMIKFTFVNEYEFDIFTKRFV